MDAGLREGSSEAAKTLNSVEIIEPAGGGVLQRGLLAGVFGAAGRAFGGGFARAPDPEFGTVTHGTRAGFLFRGGRRLLPSVPPSAAMGFLMSALPPGAAITARTGSRAVLVRALRRAASKGRVLFRH
jgi:hypothetical protein